MVKVVVVTGSGRSGTSSVAGTMKRLGMHIPQPEVEADERNPRGYYEPLWVADFHKQFLNSIPVRTIDTRPDAGEIAMAAVTPEREDLLRDWVAGVIAEPDAGEVVVVKETRAYWLYPLWERIVSEVGAEIASLTMLRHPTQVVRSRDSAYLTEMTDEVRLQRETANVAAWMNSVFETERATRGNPRAFVPYSDLIGDWRTAMIRACAQIGADPGDLAAPHPVDDFLTTSLNRSSDTWDGLTVPQALVEMAEQTWAAGQALAVDPQDGAAITELARLRAQYVDLYAASAAIASDETASQVLAVRQKLRARLTKKTEINQALRAEVRALRERLDEPGR